MNNTLISVLVAAFVLSLLACGVARWSACRVTMYRNRPMQFTGLPSHIRGHLDGYPRVIERRVLIAVALPHRDGPAWLAPGTPPALRAPHAPGAPGAHCGRAAPTSHRAGLTCQLSDGCCRRRLPGPAAGSTLFVIGSCSRLPSAWDTGIS